jgi:lipopolysaccharide/colanic/teichoic acid biosynthesis glycosyltransferase
MTEDGEPALSNDTGLNRPTLSPSLQLVFKRALDVIGALALIIVFSPVLLAAAVAVRLSSPGPALFRQRRWGWRARQFVCWKFRTMHVDQDNLVHPAMLRQLHARGVLLKQKNDPRITPVGVFLRKTSIDELPQLFNVLVGDMSLVGPRPLMLHMLEPYPELREARGRMRPGITGLWQISAREHNESALQMAAYDLAYIRGFNCWIDLKIMLKTPAAVLFGRGAY